MRRNTGMCRRNTYFIRIVQQIYSEIVLYQETPLFPYYMYKQIIGNRMPKLHVNNYLDIALIIGHSRGQNVLNQRYGGLNRILGIIQGLRVLLYKGYVEGYYPRLNDTEAHFNRIIAHH